MGLLVVIGAVMMEIVGTPGLVSQSYWLSLFSWLESMNFHYFDILAVWANEGRLCAFKDGTFAINANDVQVLVLGVFWSSSRR